MLKLYFTIPKQNGHLHVCLLFQVIWNDTLFYGHSIPTYVVASLQLK